MPQINLLQIYEELKKPGPPRSKNVIIESLQHDDAIALLKRVFHSVTSDPTNFSLDQKFLALSLDYDTNLIYADVSTGFKNSITICVDSTTLFKPKLKKFIVLLFKLPDEAADLSEYEVKKTIANIDSSGISPEDLFQNSERYELVHVKDFWFN